MDIGTVGVYGMAIKLADPLASLNQRLSRQILFPTFSSAFRDGRTISIRVVLSLRGVMDLLHLPALGVVHDGRQRDREASAWSDGFWEAGWILQILCVRTAMRCLFNPLSACCLAIDATRASR